ncbi:hypothetical protein BDB01DRAFT_842446 [Pilobolus umbonatus]|nr:hypothetical protein BDB01DRAFT_842446 [Pilobolus umbonatus]
MKTRPFSPSSSDDSFSEGSVDISDIPPPSQRANKKKRLASPESQDEYGETELVGKILDGLSKPHNCKSVPPEVLYHERGSHLFDKICYSSDDYYLASSEMDILVEKARFITARLKENSVIFELNAGSIPKTKIILDAIEKCSIQVTYYALVMDQYELDYLVSRLDRYTYIKIQGVLGSFEDGTAWINKHYMIKNIQKTFLWLGSAIGNLKHKEAILSLHRLQSMCMEPGDFIVIGFDKRNDPSKIRLAYNDTKCLVKEFILNGLDNVNSILGKPNMLNRKFFAYNSRYQTQNGYHVAHYCALREMKINQTIDHKKYSIHIKKNELIHIIHSYKYSTEEIDHLLRLTNLDMVDHWLDSKNLFRVVVAEIRPFNFKHKISEIQRGLPTTQEWNELWTLWDLVTQTMIDSRTMIYKSPIVLRHPFIFYLGHISAFIDTLFSIYKIDEGLGYIGQTEPSSYSNIFEWDTDHSEITSFSNNWPLLSSVLVYQTNVRKRLMSFVAFWESGRIFTQKSLLYKSRERKRHARIIWMCFEHAAMQIETILYMLTQSSSTLPPKGISIPSWKLAMEDKQCFPKFIPLSNARVIKILGGLISLGHIDAERWDLDMKYNNDEFGWDNERPLRQVHVNTFFIESRPITNGEYFIYMKEKSIAKPPASWIVENGFVFTRTVFGRCPIEFAQYWPVQVTYMEAVGYAQFRGCRLPTEPELMKFRQTINAEMKEKNQIKSSNIGFHNWTPTDVNNNDVYIMGDNWEWTNTVFDTHTGFEHSLIRPGYSSNFFDGNHYVALGGSWATHPRIAERRSFRQFYQCERTHAFVGFRLCHDTKPTNKAQIQ